MSVQYRQQLFITLVALLTGLAGGLIGPHHPQGWPLLITGLLLAGLALLPVLRQLYRPRPVSFASQHAEEQG